MRRLLTLSLFFLMGAVAFAQTPSETEISNSVAMQYTFHDTVRELVSNTVVTEVDSVFGLYVLKAASVDTVSAGDTLIYRITLNNTGNFPLSSVTVIDTLPEYLDILFGDPPANINGHIVSWALNSLDIGASTHVDITTIVSKDSPSTFTLSNVAWVETRSQDAVRSNESIVEIETINSAPLLSVNVTTDAVTTPGDTLLYTIAYKNDGWGDARFIELVNELDGLVEFINGSANAAYDKSAHQVTWSLGTLAPGDSSEVSFYGVVSDTAKRGDQIVDLAFIDCAEGSKDFSNFITIVHAPEINITLEASTETVNASDVFHYFITVGNTGDITATNVVLLDSLSEYVTFVSTNFGGVYDSINHTVSWEIGDIDAQSTNTETNKAGLNSTLTMETLPIYSVEVKALDVISNGTEIGNSAVVFSGESGAASVASATTGLGVISAPILTLSKTADIEVLPGDTVNYELTLSNVGSDVASAVVLKDTLDQRLTLVSISDNYQYDYDAVKKIITWDLESMNVNDSRSVSVVASVPINLNDGEFIPNRAWAQSNETLAVLAEARTTNILPLTLSLTASPYQILGNGHSTSKLKAAVYTFLGNPAPNGIPVNFFTNAGTIPDSMATIETENGFAFSTLISDTVVDDPVTANLSARAQYSETKYAVGTTEVIFLIGAFEGIITNTLGIAQEGVVVELIGSQSSTMCACDTTDVDGHYLIPILRDDLYTIRYTLIDADGKRIVNTQKIAIKTPDEGSVVTNLNSVSGWIYDGVSGEIIDEDSILVYLYGNPDSSGVALKLGKASDHHFGDSTYTDSTGQYFFTNLLPGEYELVVANNGSRSFSNASLKVNLTTPGVYVVNANMAIRQSPFYIYKEVDQSQASAGDTLDYTIYLRAIQNWNSSFTVVDQLPSELEFIDSSMVLPAGVRFDGYNIITNEIQFSRDSLMISDSLEFHLQAYVKPGAPLRQIQNIAMVTNNIDTSYSSDNGRSRAKTNIIFPYLRLEKMANKRTVEPGDVITYTVRVTNLSATESVQNFTFDDLLPRGFKLRKGSSYFNGVKQTEPSKQFSGQDRLSLNWTISDTLASNETFELKYRVIVGLNSREGIATNEVMAYAYTLLGYQVTSNVATAEVVVRPGILSDRGLIIGKVYYDSNLNGVHDNNEKTVHNVELIMETGARIRTDKYGKFSVPNVSAAMHVLRINERTLPEMVRVINDSPDYLGDTQSRIVRVAAGGIAKVSIALRESALPGTIFGYVYYDMNENSVFDEGEEVQTSAFMTLNDTLRTKVDPTGFYTFQDVELGKHVLSIDRSSLPEYALFADHNTDSLYIAENTWEFGLASGDSVRLDIPLKKQDLSIAISKQATLEMQTEMITKEFRLIAYKPWTTEIRYGFATASANLQGEIIAELQRVASLLKWQSQINLDINGHTDNIPIGNGGAFADNAALSQARANAIKDYLVNVGRIDVARISATGFGDTEPVSSNDTEAGRTENRRVEMNFYHAGGDDSEYNQLKFRYDINYSGEVEADSVHFNQSLPPGFGVIESSTRLNGVALTSVATVDSTTEWEFGDWTEETHQVLDIAIKPDDFELVKNTGIVTSSLDYLDEDGTTVRTDSLKTQITTVVSKISFNLILEGTQFGSGSADLQESALPALRKLGDFMTWQPEINIVIEGFTDNMGAEAYNIWLSEQRAAAVRDFLLNNYSGINPSMIVIKGHGPRYPVGDNTSWLGRRANRRVEVVVNAEVGEATVAEALVLNEKLVDTISRPPQPFDTPADSMITLPSGQNSKLTLHLNFPGYASADSISMTVNLLNGSYFTESEITSQTWRQSLIPGLGMFEQPIQIMIGEERTVKQEMIVYVEIYKEGESLSGQMQKIMKIGLK